jgi:Mrp family chromosome partitioning ATPase
MTFFSKILSGQREQINDQPLEIDETINLDEPVEAEDYEELNYKPESIAQEPGESGAASAAPKPITGKLQPVPPLPNVPTRWSLEVQKIAFHLTANSGGGSLSVVFSGMQDRAGTTTISYLIAHYLATERSDRRVLYADFSTKSEVDARSEAASIIFVGETDTSTLFVNNQNALTRLSIRMGRERSTAMTTKWFRDFMAAAREWCDIIIIDAPPFYGAPETYSLAKSSDGVIFILKAGETRYPAVNALVSDLGQLGIPVLGTVLNYRQYPLPKWLLRYI